LDLYVNEEEKFAKFARGCFQDISYLYAFIRILVVPREDIRRVFFTFFAQRAQNAFASNATRRREFSLRRLEAIEKRRLAEMDFQRISTWKGLVVASVADRILSSRFI